MRVEIAMPNLGYDMDSGKIAAWLKAEGDHVERGEPLVEIETDKTAVEIESLASGILIQVVTHAGETASVGDVIGYLDTQ
jgi:pyruvate/2-oxoglutarate dehydrogenase complex dihydrolipoamide acyltransferase (E2) component